MKNRDKGLDLGRLYAMIFVVGTHVVGLLMRNYPTAPASGIAMTVALILRLPGVAFVDYFFMISGAFLLGSPRTADYATLYKKAWRKLAIPTLIFSLLHFVLNPIYSLVAGDVDPSALASGYAEALKKCLMGEAADHLWYMFVLIGLYLLAPVIYKAKELFGEKTFKTVAYIMLIWGFISSRTDTFGIHWSLGRVIIFVGIFMLGYEIYTGINGEKSNKKAFVNLLIWILIMVVGLIVFMITRNLGNVYINGIFAITQVYDPLVQIGAIFLFKGFLYLEPKHDYGYLGALTYWVYLGHILFYEWIVRIPIEEKFRFYNNAGVGGGMGVAFIYTLISYVGCMIIAHIATKVFGSKKKK